jgi:WD40 repeat protein
MLAASGEQHIWVWSGRTGKLLWHHDKQNNVTALAWSADNRQLATTEWGLNGDKGAVHIWQGESGNLLHEAPVPVYRLAWSPDGKTLAAAVLAVGEHTVALLDPTGKVLAKSSKGAGWIEALRWSSDGKSFVTASTRHDGTQVCVWDGEHCAHVRTARLPWLIPPDHAVAWSPDGRLLAWSNDREFYLATADAHPLGVLLPQDSCGQLAVTADGHYRGNARVERLIRMVVQKSDGTSETLTPLEFEQKYGFKNDPAKVRLTGD